MKTQLKEVEELCATLNAACDEIKTKIQETQQENERMPEEIRKIQMEALQKNGRSATESTSTLLR
jgi:prefoldin subunit 5